MRVRRASGAPPSARRMARLHPTSPRGSATMMVSRGTLAMAALILGATLGALAASADDLAPPSLPPSQGQPAVPPAPDQTTPDQGGALSDKLSRSHGVIAPPPVQDK